MGGVIGLLGLLLLGLATQALVKASVNYATARRIVELSLTGREILALTWATTVERGDNLYALLGEPPIKPATEQAIAERRTQSLVHFDKARKLLAGLHAGQDGAALADLVAQFRSAYDALAPLRPAVDAAVRLPRGAREAGLSDRWRDAADRLMTTLGVLTARVDAALELHAPLIDLLLTANRAAVAARFHASQVSSQVSGSIATARPWSQEDIVRVAELRGRIAAEWDVVTHAATTAAITPGLKAAVEAANAAYFGNDTAYRQPILDALAAGRPPGVTIDDWLTHALPSTGSVGKVAEAALDDVVAVADSNIAEARHSLLMDGAVLLVATVLTASGFLIVWVRVSRPVMVLAQVMRRLADRDFSVDVPGTERADELGAMAKTVETFRANGVAMQQLEAAAAEQRRVAEAEREAAAARQARQAAELAEVVDGLGAALARLADGDLTCAVERQFAPGYERLRIDLNAALAGLAAAMRDITQHGDTIGSSTQEIAGATDDLARRTERQAATLEQTAAALQQIVATVGKTAAGSQEARVIATEAQGDAERSGQVVRDAVVAMDAIASSARQISQIIGVIDEIAFQTNLLALNAGVEAARAGEAGRGFAVVASEVRALAQRSADAAKQIKALITTSSQQVERGVALVGETGNTLGRILAQMGTISRVIGDIAASVQRQAEALGEVNAAVSEMDKVTQKNAAMVEQTAAAAATRALSHETELLSAANGRFRIEKIRITRAA